MGKKITEVLIGIAMNVHNELRNGYLEKVYENALILELRAAPPDHFAKPRLEWKRLVGASYHEELETL